MSSAKAKQFTKMYDMPPGQDVCASYEMFARHTAADRAIGITAISRPDGSLGTYVYSGELASGELAKLDHPNDPDGWKHNCVRMVIGARLAAIRNGCRPLP